MQGDGDKAGELLLGQRAYTLRHVDLMMIPNDLHAVGDAVIDEGNKKILSAASISSSRLIESTPRQTPCGFSTAIS